MYVKIGPYKEAGERDYEITIHDSDVFSMDYTLAMIILPMLYKLKDNKQGSPFVDDVDVPDEIKRVNSTYTDVDETDEFHHDRWDYILNELIWTFEQILRDDREDQFYSGELDIQSVKDEKTGLYELVIGPKNTFEVDYEAQRTYEERIQQGLNLFGKYYQSLWT